MTPPKKTKIGPKNSGEKPARPCTNCGWKPGNKGTSEAKAKADPTLRDVFATIDSDAVAKRLSKFTAPIRERGNVANRIKKFYLGDSFQAEFDAWVLEVEEGGGSLEVSNDEIILGGSHVLIFWSVRGPRGWKGPA